MNCWTIHSDNLIWAIGKHEGWLWQQVLPKDIKKKVVARHENSFSGGSQTKTFGRIVCPGRKIRVHRNFSPFWHQCKTVGSLSPFGVALSMALPRSILGGVNYGALAGYSLLEILRKTSLSDCIAGSHGAEVRYCRHSRGSEATPPFSVPPQQRCWLSASSSATPCSTRELLSLIFCLCESVLGGALTYFAFHASKIVLGRKKLPRVGLSNGQSLAVVVLVGL